MITVILANKLVLLEDLKSHIERMEKEDPKQPDNPKGEPAIDRVNWAIFLVRQESLLNQEILADLRQSLTAVCLCGTNCKMKRANKCKFSCSSSDQSSKTSWQS